jgi:drug/metabolite transporter (DMT)-like permease
MPIAYFLLVLSMILFASSLVAIRAALVSYPPMELACFRFVCASATLLVIALVAGIRRPGRKDLRLVLFVGFLFFLNMIGSNFGLRTITAGEASFILNIVPLLTALLAWILLGEPITRLFAIGLAVSFAGVSLVVVNTGGGLALRPGTLFLFLAALTFAIFQIVQKRLLEAYTPLEVASYAVWGATVMLLPFGADLPDMITRASAEATAAAVYLGVFPSAIAYVVWFAALRKVLVSRAAVFFYFVPVLTVLLGFLWLGEMPAAVSLVGGVLVVGGVVVANMGGKGTREWRRDS